MSAGWEWKVPLLMLNTKEGWDVDGLSQPSSTQLRRREWIPRVYRV